MRKKNTQLKQRLHRERSELERQLKKCKEQEIILTRIADEKYRNERIKYLKIYEESIKNELNYIIELQEEKGYK